MEHIPSLDAVPSVNPPVPANNKYKLAFVIDGVVVSTVLTDARSAAIFTSSPQVIQIEVNTDIMEGTLYDGVNFTNPESL